MENRIAADTKPLWSTEAERGPQKLFTAARTLLTDYNRIFLTRQQNHRRLVNVESVPSRLESRACVH